MNRLALLLSFIPTCAAAQTLPTGTIDVPPTVVGSNESMGSGTTVNVLDGGGVGGAFSVGLDGVVNTNTVLNVEGGIIGYSLAVYDGAVVNVSGGRVGRDFTVYSGGVTSLSGGFVDFGMAVRNGGEANISASAEVVSLLMESGASVTQTGGEIQYDLRVESGGVMEISGGHRPSRITSLPGSQVTFFGGDFLVNGAAASTGPQALGAADVLTGVLEDGTVVIQSQRQGDTLGGIAVVATSAPGYDTTPISITGESLLHSLRPGQQLTVSGEAVFSRPVNAVDASVTLESGYMNQLTTSGGAVAIQGGSIGRVYALQSTSVTVTGGELVGPINSYDGSTVEVTGGVLEWSSEVGDGSTWNVRGGQVLQSFKVREGGVLNFTGGAIGDDNRSSSSLNSLEAHIGSQVNVYGGTIGPRFSATGGSDVKLYGGEFLVNGAAPAGSTVTLTGDDVMTGTLEDGSPFVVAASYDTIVGVQLVERSLPVKSSTPTTIGAGDVAPAGLRAGESLRLVAGGQLPVNFAAVGASLSIEGGEVRDGLEVADSLVEISGGAISQKFGVFRDAVVNVSGGEFGRRAQVFWGGVMNLSGGHLGFNSEVEDGGILNASGGAIDKSFVAAHGSLVNLAGAAVDTSMDANGGSEVNLSGGTLADNFEAKSGSVVNVFGTSFLLNGEPIDGLTVGGTVTVTARGSNQSLTGVLADGSPIDLGLSLPNLQFRDKFDSSATLTVTLLDDDFLVGDFNSDGVVDAADYTVWRDAEGAEGVTRMTGADANGDGRIDRGDYDLWRRNFGSSTAGATATPEPSGAVLGLIVLAAILGRGKPPGNVR